MCVKQYVKQIASIMMVVGLASCGGGGGGNPTPAPMNQVQSGVVSDSGNQANQTQGSSSPQSYNENLLCSYNYERSACEALTEIAYVTSFTTGTGNNCPSDVHPDLQENFIALQFSGDIGTCVADFNTEQVGGLGNFDRLSGNPDDMSTGSGVAVSNEVTTGTSRFRLQDACNDGLGLEARFHEARNGQRTGSTWPSSSQVFTTPSGGTIDRNLNCTIGTSICYGARPPGVSGGWGIGVEGNSSCENCCVSCGSDRGVGLSC